MSSLTSLAEGILASAKRLDEYTSSQNLPSVSFDDDSLDHLPPDLESVRNALIDSTHNLKQLVQGPVGRTVETMFNVRPDGTESGECRLPTDKRAVG